MEEPKYEYDWRHPITVPNPKNKSGVSVENGSFKWFQYWLEHDCTYKEVAEYFNTSENNIQVIASLFKWRERKRNKEDHDSRQREALQLERYKEFIDTDYNNATTQLNSLYTLSQIALIFLGVLPPQNNLEIPSDMDANKAIKILQGNPQAINKMHNQILRDLEKSDKINDKQEFTADITSKNLNLNMKTDAELDELYENRFKEFINTALGRND